EGGDRPLGAIGRHVAAADGGDEDETAEVAPGGAVDDVDIAVLVDKAAVFAPAADGGDDVELAPGLNLAGKIEHGVDVVRREGVAATDLDAERLQRAGIGAGTQHGDDRLTPLAQHPREVEADARARPEDHRHRHVRPLPPSAS